jgi:DNA-directed RNA polymerase subunit RPC12/RpoP
MIKINGFKVGYKCPYCQYIRPEENMERCAIVWIDGLRNGNSELKCPTCGGEEILNNWEMVMYPCVE